MSFDVATPWERVKASNLWDESEQLPTIPEKNNPWLYCAYVYRIMLAQMSSLDLTDFASALRIRFATLEKASGYVWRWETDSRMSHDELLGAAYLSKDFAGRALDLLTRNDGAYTVRTPRLDDYVNRFAIMVPALKALAGFDVSVLSQLQFGLAAAWNAYFAHDGDASDALMFWLCLPAMRKFPVSKACCDLFEWKWMKRGVNPKAIFTKIYLKECPLLGEFAKETFE